jgi:hypothetical protein
LSQKRRKKKEKKKILGGGRGDISSPTIAFENPASTISEKLDNFPVMQKVVLVMIWWQSPLLWAFKKAQFFKMCQQDLV